MPVKKKTTLKQKQRQSQKVVVNIDNSNRAPKRRRRNTTSNKQSTQQQQLLMRQPAPIIINNTPPQPPHIIQPAVQQPQQQFNNSGFKDINDRLNDMSRNFSNHAQNIGEQLNKIHNNSNNNAPNVYAEPIYDDSEPSKTNYPSAPIYEPEPYNKVPTYAQPPKYTPPIFTQPKMERVPKESSYPDLNSITKNLFKTPTIHENESSLIPYSKQIEELKDERNQVMSIYKNNPTDISVIRHINFVNQQIKELTPKKQELTPKKQEETALVPYEKPKPKNNKPDYVGRIQSIKDDINELNKNPNPGAERKKNEKLVEISSLVEQQRKVQISSDKYNELVDILRNQNRDISEKQRGEINTYRMAAGLSFIANVKKAETALKKLEHEEIRKVLKKKQPVSSEQTTDVINFGRKDMPITKSGSGISNSKNVIV